ncbi:MAG TPA: PHB depolymerase family esterase [Verrucomicrobiae bacterium]|nr:PHB depolymerase family esterase [Verrucomicrobiae bacterium]
MRPITRRDFLPRCAVLFALALGAQAHAAGDGGEQTLRRIELTVEGIVREVLVYVPPAAESVSSPLVFVFHGHGGTSQGVARGFGIHRLWPEAIVVYPQGLKTPGRLTDPEGKRPGWQHGVGAQEDRDLKFFDAMLARLERDFKVDERRIYSTGHSNGGAFTYLLWAERGSVFAAVAPSGSAATQSLPKLKAKPCLHIAGEKDPLVKFEWQKATIEAVRKLNGCDAEGREWEKDCTIYPSKTGTPFVAFIHPGGHGFPAEAPAVIVKFFRETKAAQH